MPGPFPGMDPYLEAPQYWEPFHDRLVFHLGSVLQEVLPGHYVAQFRQRVELVFAQREILPDVTVTRVPRPGGTSTATLPRPPDPAVHLAARLEESTERYIEIIRIPEQHLVTIIELSSPTNKTDSRGRAAYVAKQTSVLSTDVSLVEIDLLRAGPHWACIPDELVARHQPYDYLVCVSRARDRSIFECYFRTVREPLPAVAVPLTAGEPDATLEIQEAFDRAYDQGRHEAWVRYDRIPAPPLGNEDQEWARGLLRDVGLLGSEASD